MSPSSESGGILTATSSDGTLAAVHVPTPPTGGASLRHSIKLYDLAVTRRLKSTLVASVEAADGPIVQLALAQPAQAENCTAPCSYLAARLSPETTARPDKILVWDLTRGVVGCTLTAPPSTHYRGLAIQSATLFALCVHRETGKVMVMEHDVSPEGGGQLRRKVKCPSLDVEEVNTTKLGLAVAPTNVLAVRLGDALRIIDGSTGKKLAKCKVRGDDDNTATGSSGASNPNTGGGAATPVLFSSDAALLATPSRSGLQIFSVAEGGKPLYTVSSHGGQPVADAAIRAIEGGKHAVLTVEPTGGCACLSECGGAASASASGGGKKGGSGSKKGGSSIATLATIRCAEDGNGVVAAAFHGASPGNKVVVLAMPSFNAPSVAVGGVEVDEINYRDEDGHMVRGDIVVGDANDEDGDMDGDGAAAGGGGSKKKKRALPSGELVLGPGETGGEALGVTDRTSKRAKVGGAGGDDDDAAGDDDDADEDEFVLPDDDATEEAAGATIADRLALLTSEAADYSDDESEDEEAVAALYGADAVGRGGAKKKRKATSESLSTLLRQALSSNDDSQLEVALHVHDKRVIENSIATLAREDEEADDGRDDMITKLLGKLVDRLGRKPGRAEELSIWVQTVLLILISGKSMSRRERDVAAKLAPLRSMLNERVESLPHLLRLEGRLSLLGQQL